MPYFQEQAQKINHRIERSEAIKGVKEGLLEIRRLHDAGHVTDEMLADAEQEYEAFAVSIFSEIITRPKVTPTEPQPPITDENIVKLGDTVEISVSGTEKPAERYIIYNLGTPDERRVKIEDVSIGPTSGIIEEGNKRYLVGSVGPDGTVYIDEAWEVAPTIEQVPILETKPEEEITVEAEKLPVVVINRAKREIGINGQVVSLNTEIYWKSLMGIIEAGEDGISSRDLGSVARKAGSNTARNPAGVVVNSLKVMLRSVLSSNFDVDKLIVRSGTNQDAVYHFKAELQFPPSDLIINEGKITVVWVDGFQVNLTAEEMALLKVLNNYPGTLVGSRLLAHGALNADDPVQARLSLKMAGLAKKINYPYGDKFIESKMAGSNSGYKLQNVKVEYREAEVPTEPEERIDPAEKAQGYIENIQKLINEGALTNPDRIKRVQETAAEFGGTINFISKEIEIEESEETEISFDVEEQAVLARFIDDLNMTAVKISDELEFKIALELGTVQGCRRLVEQFYKDNPEHINGELKQLREKVINKLDKLLKDEAAEDRVLRLAGDFGILVSKLRILDETISPSRLTEFLAARAKNEKYSDEVVHWVRNILRHQVELERRFPSRTTDESPIRFETMESNLVSKPMSQQLEQLPETEQLPVPEVREDTFIVVTMFLHDSLSLTTDDVIDMMSEENDDQKFSWISAINSMVRLVGVLDKRVLKGVATDEETGVLIKIRELLGQQAEEDIELVMPIWKEKLVDWYQQMLIKEANQISDLEVLESSSPVTGPKFRKLTREELNNNTNTKSETRVSKNDEKKKSRGVTKGIMDTREIERYAISKGFRVTNGGSDLKIVDQDGNLICPIPGHHGGKDLKKGTFRGIIKKIDERAAAKEKTGNNQ